nr:TSCPD domain-containing protein [Acetivibrio straminisolvens]
MQRHNDIQDGSRDLQVLNIGKVKGKEESDSKEKEPTKPVSGIAPRPRSEIATGFTEKVKIGCGNLYITVNYDDYGICEVFTNTGRAGGCPSQSEATARLVSIALRSGVDYKYIVEQLKGIRCPSTIRQKGLKVLSCPDAIGRLIEKVAKIQNGQKDAAGEISITEEQKFQRPTANTYYKLEETLNDEADFKVAELEGDTENGNTAVCPECGKKVEHEGGCVVCRSCGYSKCG